jgi:oligopeptide transport system substrate-binding protein
LDPRRSSDFVSATLISQLFEGLTRCQPDGSVALAAAEEVTISEDGRVYLFRLRSSVWSDGVPLSAHDFEWAWKRQLDPSFPALSGYLLYPVRNAARAARGECGLEEVGIIALDAQTLRVELEQPTEHFLALTAFPTLMPVPQHALGEIEEAPVSKRVINGPFAIERVVPHASLVLKKNQTYWNRDAVRLERIEIHIVPDETTALQMFEKGEIDWLGGAIAPIPPEALETGRFRDQTRFFPVAATTFCAFNTGTPPFHNRHIRRAFSLAIDREEMAFRVTSTKQIPASRIIPPSLAEGTPLLRSSKEEARAELALGLTELGLETLDPVTFHFRAGPNDRQVALALQRQWRECLGLEVILQQSDFKRHKDILHRRDYQIALTNWIAQYPSPLNILERFKEPGHAKNYPGWAHSAFSTLVEQAAREADPVLRHALEGAAESILAEEAPIAPIYHWSLPSLCSPRLKNMATTPSGGVLFERCWIDAN